IRENVTEETEGTVYALKGYTVNDASHGRLGTVSEIDDQTANILLIVKKDNGDEIMIPVADEYIKEIDDDSKQITLQLPDGFLDL
ncbi:MAG: 16S rRNA processing protein RimM, partial [Paludibacteraceae bacterium]|nr:16S rRNA processing protein RimM [Paludibacteraceae bacterium]